MRKKDYLLLYVICAIFYSGLLLIQHAPGYMDAEYYYAGGLQLAGGNGFFEPYVWNYLSVPAQLPVPAFLYWMPLTSLTASMGITVLQATGYFAARIPLILLAGLIPVMTAYFAQQFSTLKGAGWYAGVIAIIGGYYLPFMTQTDTFVLYMICGGGFFILLMKMWSSANSWVKGWAGFLLLGVIVGLMHLARADGILWLLAAILSVWLPRIFPKAFFDTGERKIRVDITRTLEVIGSYLAVMGAWYTRNVRLFGSVFPPDNGKNLWLTEYNDLFSFPSSVLTFERWKAMGVGKIITDRILALGINLETLIGVSGGIILGGFMIVGIIRYRKSPMVSFFVFLLVAGIIVMSFVFPYAGARGGFFHSVAAFQPVLWGLVPAGIDAAIELGVRKRNWQKKRSWLMFGTTILGVFLLITGFVFISKLQGTSSGQGAWDQQLTEYKSVNDAIIGLDGDSKSSVMVVDPPGFYLASDRPAIVTPQGDLSVVKEVASIFDVRYLILDKNLTKGLEALYDAEVPVPGFTLAKTMGDFKIFELER